VAPRPMEPSGRTRHREIPVPDDAALRRIAGIGVASLGSDGEGRERSASLLLDEAEKECRSYRFTEATRPFLAEIFLRRGSFVSGREGVRRRGLFPVSGVASDSPGPCLFPRRCCPYGKRSGTALSRGGAPGRVAPSGAEIFVTESAGE